MKLGPLQRKWVETLKKYPHRQINEVLGERKKNGHVKACCLGQALLCIKEYEGERLPVGELTSDGEEGVIQGHFEKIGLYDEEGMIKSDDKNDYDCLVQMNDGGCTWPEIAEFIENNPNKVFTKSV